MSSIRMSFHLIAAALLVSASIFGVVSNYQQTKAGLLVESGQRRLTGEGERPIIYTYYEQPEVYKPNDDTLDLIENWRKSWYDMGWNPIILTAQQAQSLPGYEQLMSLIPDASLINPEAVRNYKRWMAMAFVGGGWLSDYTVWPLNYFLQHGRVLPYDGALTSYMGTNPVLLSGTGEEYLRMVHQIGQTAEKVIGHQKWLNENYPESYKKSAVWNDAVALQELRKVSKDMFKTRGDVTERARITAKDDGSIDCDVTNGKRAIFYRGLTTNAQENRGTQARKFLNQWRTTCGVAQSAGLQVA